VPNATGWYQFAGPVDATLLIERFPGLAATAEVDGDRVVVDHQRRDYLALIEEIDDLRTDAIAGSVAVEDGFGLVVRLPARWIPPRFDVESVPPMARARVGSLEGLVGAEILDLAWSADGSLLATAHQFDGLAVATIWRGEEEGRLRRLHEIPVGERWLDGACLGFAARALIAWTGRVRPGGDTGVLTLVHAEDGHVLRTKEFDGPIRCAASAPDGFGLAVMLEGERQIWLLDAGLEAIGARTVYADYDHLHFGSRGRLAARGPEGIDAMDFEASAELGRFEGSYTAGIPLEDGGVVARTGDGRVVVLAAGHEPREIEALAGARAIAATGRHVFAWLDRELVGFDLSSDAITSRRSVSGVEPRHVARARRSDRVAWTDGTRVVLPSHPDPAAPLDGLVAGGALAVRRGDTAVHLLDPLVPDAPVVALPAEAWVAPTADGSVFVVAEAVDGGRPTERGLTRVDFRTADETLGTTYLSDARTADLSPGARLLVVEVDGAFSLVTAVGGEFRGHLGPVVDLVAFAIAAPVGLRRTRDGLRRVELVPEPPPPVILPEANVDHAALAEDGTFFVSVGERLACWECTEAQLRWARGDWSADHVAVSPDGRKIVLTVGGGVHWFSAADGRHLDSQAGHPHGIQQITFRDDGSLLTLGLEGTVVHWKARGERRATLPGAAEALRVAFAARDQAMRTPWSRRPREGDGEASPGSAGAPLPPLLAAISPPDPSAGVRIEGAVTYFGDGPRDEAVRDYGARSGRAPEEDLQVDGRTLAIDVTLPREATPDGMVDALLALTRRALVGAIEVRDPRQIHHFTFEAGVIEPPTPRYEVVPGARARLSRLRAPHWQEPPQVEERGGWLWWLGPYDPEEGERAGPVAPVQRLRVIDQATGQQIWSQRLSFEGRLSVAPDGRLALLTADDPVEALEEQVGLKLLDPGDNRVVELIEGAYRFSRLVQWAPDGASFGFVSEGEDDTRVEIRDRDGARRFRLGLRAWTFLTSDELVCAGDSELAFVDVTTGAVIRTLPWARHDHQLIAYGSGFVALGEEGIAIVDGEGAIERSLPDLRLEEGVVLAEEEGESVLVGPRGERVRLSDGQPLSAPGYIEAAAIRGPAVASWHGEELLVRQWSTGEVRIRERVYADPRWVGQPSLAWAGESVVLAVDDRIRCLDPDGTWRVSGRVGLVAVAPGPGGQVQTAHRDGLVRLYDVETGTVAVESRLPFPVEAFAGHAAATHAVVRTGSTVRHVVLETGEVLGEVADVPVGVRLALSPNGRSFAVAGPERVVIGGGGFDRRTLDIRARSLVFLHDHRRLAIGGDDDRIYVVMSATGEIEGRLVGHHGYVEVLDTDGTTLLSAAVDGLVWSLDGLELMGFSHDEFLDPTR